MAEYITKFDAITLAKVFKAKDDKKQAAFIGKTVFDIAVAPYAMGMDADNEFRRMKAPEKAAFVSDVIDELGKLVVDPVLSEQPKGIDTVLPQMLMAHFVASSKGRRELWRYVCEIVRLQHKPPLLSGIQAKRTFDDEKTMADYEHLCDLWHKMLAILCKSYKL